MFKKIIGIAILLSISNFALAFDQSHQLWTKILTNYVHIDKTNPAISKVDYAKLQQNQENLLTYLDQLSKVSTDEYDAWSSKQQLSFLINAYNAFTIKLILSKYPDLQSIKDLGGFFSSPWKKEFIPILDHNYSLDNIEHDLIRSKFKAPKIHFALVCASISCPMLQPKAFIADTLDVQLESAMRLFLSDRSRNYFDAKSGELKVSKIFKWYGDDFTYGYDNFTSLKTTFSFYINSLANNLEDQIRIQQGNYRLEFIEYDWHLNDIKTR